MAIRKFVPGKYFAMVSREKTKGEIVELTSKHKFEQDQLAEAQRMCALYNQTGAVVTAVKNKKDKLSAGKLFRFPSCKTCWVKSTKCPCRKA